MELLATALAAGLCYLAYRMIRSRGPNGGAPGSGKCTTCRHAEKVFDDGTLCRFGRSSVFKNPVNVANCVDHRPLRN